ncbi:hypothetical protein ACHAXA_003012 [Cyclostephanos tholiformis]|uniref:Uncharacterized protein n=1 Tax=Cyclostephanos tholiformis TaxID=382380 RepID=A0ABD3R984_9STRA
MKTLSLIIASLACGTRDVVKALLVVSPSRTMTTRHEIVPPTSSAASSRWGETDRHRGRGRRRHHRYGDAVYVGDDDTSCEGVVAAREEEEAEEEEDDASSSSSAYYHRLLSMFQGDFDNYDQVVRDRERGLTPGEGGGHEHIHCTLVPCPRRRNHRAAGSAVVGGGEYHRTRRERRRRHRSRWVLAAFYFNGDPGRIFRFRLYRFVPPQSNDATMVRMELRTLSSSLEGRLRALSEEPCLWWREVWNAWEEGGGNDDTSRRRAVEECHGGIQAIVGSPTMSSPLEGCDVLWDPNWDPMDHPYLYARDYVDIDPTYPGESSAGVGALARPQLPEGISCHATMEAGSDGAIVDSISMIPGKRILIKDELSIWKDEFWINDRGYDPDYKLAEMINDKAEIAMDDSVMPFVYGNRRGVPYKLKRVSNFVDDAVDKELPRPTIGVDLGLQLKRVVANTDLVWTLGERYR